MGCHKVLINLPSKFSKKDIKYHGIIQKDEGYTYVLSDVRDTNNIIELKSDGFYSYVYTLCDTYLFIIGNCKRLEDINPNKINFLNKIMEFEYKLQNNPKKFKYFDIPNNILTITSKQRWLEGHLSDLNSKEVYFIINNIKTHLNACQTPLEKQLRYLCDNETGMGLCKNAFSLNMLCDTKLKIYKDTEISGYIIKYNHDLF